MRFSRATRLVFVSVAAAAMAPFLVGTLVSVQGCGPQAPQDGPDASQADASVEVLHPDASPLPGESSCEVTITKGIEVPPAAHVPYCTHVDYPTNPPSGGNHWGTWAAYKPYTIAVPREVYVHDEEHGGVVLAYRCDGSCPEIVSALQSVFDGVTADPLCLANGSSPKARVVLTPDPELDTPIAAAAWGATYTATCIDEASLSKFVSEVYGKGTEATCAQGVDLESLDGGIGNCDGGP